MRLTKHRLDKLSDIASDVGLVSLASVVLPAVLDKFDLTQVILGGTAALICWVVSIWIRK
ncbi:hypothetical protein HY087_02065 [Candidatus Gottesmanbacteria bacterium]|nr:hypothetical protein [Candidatus Gottesmanbacteria bacterium]